MKNLLFILFLLLVPFILTAQIIDDGLSVQDHLFAGLSYSSLIAGYIVAGMCILLRWFWRAGKGVKKKTNASPSKFSWPYWIQKNVWNKLTSLFANIIVLYLLFRFGEQFIGEKFTIGLSAVIGLSMDYFVEVLKKFQFTKK